MINFVVGSRDGLLGADDFDDVSLSNRKCASRDRIRRKAPRAGKGRNFGTKSSDTDQNTTGAASDVNNAVPVTNGKKTVSKKAQRRLEQQKQREYTAKLLEGEDESALFRDAWVNGGGKKTATTAEGDDAGVQERANRMKWESKICLDSLSSKHGSMMDHSSKNSLEAAEAKTNKFRELGITQDSRATVQQCLDQLTFNVLHKFFNAGVFESIHGCISTGKEANVYYANTKKSAEEIFGGGTADLETWKEVTQKQGANGSSSKNLNSDSEIIIESEGPSGRVSISTNKEESEAAAGSGPESDSDENPPRTAHKVCFQLEADTQILEEEADEAEVGASESEEPEPEANFNYSRAPLVAQGRFPLGPYSSNSLNRMQSSCDENSLLEMSNAEKKRRLNAAAANLNSSNSNETAPYKKNKTGIYFNKEKSRGRCGKTAIGETESEDSKTPPQNQSQATKSILKESATDSHITDLVNTTTTSTVTSTTALTTTAVIHSKMDLAVKIFKTSVLAFKDRTRYTEGDYRFRSGCTRGNPRKMVQLWCEKEFRNLKRINQKAKLIKAPIPIDHRNNVLVMTLIGRAGVAAMRLKDVNFVDPDAGGETDVETADESIEETDEEEVQAPGEMTSNSITKTGSVASIGSNSNTNSLRRAGSGLSGNKLSKKTLSNQSSDRDRDSSPKTLNATAPSPKPLLTNNITSAERWDHLYLYTCRLIRDLFKNVGLVHGDLSEYNMLYYLDTIYMIDVSQAVESDHPQALDFLKRDCMNVNTFFGTRRGVAVMSLRTLYKFVTMDSDSNTGPGGEPCVSEIRDRFLESQSLRDAEKQLNYQRKLAAQILAESNQNSSDSLNLNLNSIRERQAEFNDFDLDEDEAVFQSTWVPSNLHQISCYSAMAKDMDRREAGDRVLCEDLLAPMNRKGMLQNVNSEGKHFFLEGINEEGYSDGDLDNDNEKESQYSGVTHNSSHYSTSQRTSQTGSMSKLKDKTRLMERKEQLTADSDLKRGELHAKRSEKWRKFRDRKREKHEKRIEQHARANELAQNESANIKSRRGTKESLEKKMKDYETQVVYPQIDACQVFSTDSNTPRKSVFASAASGLLSKMFDEDANPWGCTDQSVEQWASSTVPVLTVVEPEPETPTISPSKIGDLTLVVSPSDLAPAPASVPVENIAKEIITEEPTLVSDSDCSRSHRSDAISLVSISKSSTNQKQNNTTGTSCESVSEFETEDATTDHDSTTCGGRSGGGNSNLRKEKRGERDPNLTKAEWKAKIKEAKRAKRAEKIPKSLKKKHKKKK